MDLNVHDVWLTPGCARQVLRRASAILAAGAAGEPFLEATGRLPAACRKDAKLCAIVGRLRQLGAATLEEARQFFAGVAAVMAADADALAEAAAEAKAAEGAAGAAGEEGAAAGEPREEEEIYGQWMLRGSSSPVEPAAAWA